MQEIELKFLVPEYKLDALMRQTNIKSAQTSQLAAHYYDTPEQQLAAAGMALRIRKEDADWVQTFKATGDGIAARIEHNHILDAETVAAAIAEQRLQPDLNVYTDTPIAKLLDGIDSQQLAEQMQRQYVTDVKRVTRLVKKDGKVVEIAFDKGSVIHGEDSSQQQPLQEIEFELLEGDAAFLFDTAKTWCKRYKLCLSTVTKAERGGLLLQDKSHCDAVKSDLQQLQISKKMSQPQFMRAVVHNCLLQILPNASAIAAGSPDGNHVHQLRVGIRRLRTALKLFADFCDDLNPEWTPILKQTFSLLGEYRDREILQTKTQPMLEQQGSPHVDWQMDIKVMPVDAVRANDFQLTLLELIEYALSDAPKVSKHAATAKDAVTQIIDKLFKKVSKASDKFAQLDTEAQHDVRKRLKSLRYVSEFAAPMFKGKKSKKFIQYLEPAQDLLGDYNDNIVGHEHYLNKSASDPNALFAVGWFYAREQAAADRCSEALHSVKNAPVFW